MTDEQILAAARDAGIVLYRDVASTERWRCDCVRTKLFALYRAAYTAGMEAAAVIADDMLGCETDAVADAIRAANGREGKA